MAVKRSPRRGPRILRDQRPLDADQVVAAAVRLTRLHGLEIWTLRQLADELEAWPAVIYHHVGDREAVTAAVVDRVLSDLLDADVSQDWREWFGTLLRRLWLVLREHSGVAQWLVANGAMVPAMLRLMDQGVAILDAAGFGDEAPVVFSMLVGAALSQIAMEDGHDAPSYSREEVARMIGEYRGSADHGGLALMAVACEDFWTCDDLYVYRMERTLDGVAVRLAELRSTTSA